MSKKTLWQDMLKIKPTIKLQQKYKNYRYGGGEKSFEEWKKTQ